MSEGPRATEPLRNPKPSSSRGGGLGCSWHGAACKVGKQSFPPGWQQGRSRLLASWLARCLFGFSTLAGVGSGGERAGGGRDGDTLYTGNTCLMRDTRLAPQAGTAPGLLKHGG